MKLNEYLELVRKCPDNKLTDEFGIYDNWNIFLKGDYYEYVQSLVHSCLWTVSDTSYYIQSYFDFEKRDYNRVYLLYAPQPLFLAVEKKICYHEETNSKEDSHKRYQLANYNIYLSLHSSFSTQKRELFTVSWRRAMVLAIEDIVKTSSLLKMDLCFPKSIGWKYLDYDKVSQQRKIVYYPDSIEKELNL